VIGIFGKESAVWNAAETVANRKAHANNDVVPAGIWARLDVARGSRSWAELGREAGFADCTNLHVGKRGLSRDRLLRLARATGDRELAAIAESDVYWDEVVSIEPLGERHVYDLTIPETHNFVANDMCVHNTSFVLNLAVNVASPRSIAAPGPNDRGYGSNERREPGYGVAVFSLEMPREQLGTRMVCSEARVDVGKLRGGHLTPEDWRRLTEGASYLSMLPIWLDDTPAIGLLELRAKVRRMQAEYNRPATAEAPERRMGLIVIDYLQLMSGRPNAQSREQEISEISRGLKQLAKELRVPVIALSQLNRAVETRTTKDKRPQLSDLRECVTGDTLVWLANGRRVPILDLVDTKPRVFAMQPDGRVVRAASDRVWRVGVRPVFDVRLASGRSVRATAKHRLYTGAGWQRVEQMVPGDRVAIARSVPRVAGAAPWSEARLALLAHLIGDGSYLVHQPMRYTTANEEHARAVEDAARVEFGARVTRHAGRGNWFQLVIAGNGNRWHPAGVGKWLRELGIHGQRSHDKHVPDEIFQLSDDQLGVFLRHLWATDGCISVRPEGQKGSDRVFFATSSERLARDVAALLLRLGIVARIRAMVPTTGRPVWSVDVSGGNDQLLFLDRVGAFGAREAPARRLRARLRARPVGTNVDTLPVQVWDRVRTTMAERGVTTRAMSAMRGTAYGGTSHFRFAPSRSMISSYATALEDPELARVARSELYWDRVVSITPAGREEVFDLTVPGPASWLADGIVSHNSGAIEQDADTIIFIYREEYYFPESSEAKGIAELIIAKQRNGPTGKIYTRWTASCTRFDSLQPGDYPEFSDE